MNNTKPRVSTNINQVNQAMEGLNKRNDARLITAKIIALINILL